MIDKKASRLKRDNHEVAHASRWPLYVVRLLLSNRRDNYGNINCNWNDPERLGKGAGIVGNRRTNRDHPNSSKGQNTKKSPGDVRRLPVNLTPVKDHQLTQV